MESVCTECGKKFESHHENEGICKQCLEAEFGNAPEVEPLDNVTSEELEKLDETNRISMIRAAARAERMNASYNSGTNFSSAGKVRYIIGLVVFFLCIIIFILNGTKDDGYAIITIAPDSLRILSITFAIVSCGFILTSSKQHKKLRFITIGIIAILGWYTPNIWSSMQDKPIAISESDEDEEPAQVTEEAENTKLITESDLREFYSRKIRSKNRTHYAIFIRDLDPALRNNVRDALKRLLTAEATVVFGRDKGFFYIVENAAGALKDITHVAQRFGKVNASHVTGRVYEVIYDEAGAGMINKFSKEIQQSKDNPYYAQANIAELKSKDPERIRSSAETISTSKSRLYGADIYDTLYEVLQDPWSSEAQTYNALVKALITYSGPGNQKTIKESMQLLNFNITNKKITPDAILQYLIANAPEQVVRPLIDLWISNPIHWEKTLTNLEPHVIKLLDQKENRDLTINILKFLSKAGTQLGIKKVEELTKHKDTLISQQAQSTYNVLKNR